MNVIFILIGVSLLVAIGFLVSFIWSIRSGQYEDDYTPSVRILFDDEVVATKDGMNTNNADKQDDKDSKANNKKPKT